ncbi:DNA methyltransferase [Vulcanisaeta sp. JCM 16161]|uniref:DNA methyltransferase n=1 Tax=Vulcanisaeta sp. JCM 16161 TaxID=1295372 RepID=UPI00406CC9B4
MRLVDEQYRVQERLPNRKETSSYYTSPDGIAVIRTLLSTLSEKERVGVTVMDPFMGSGVLLSAINDLIKPRAVIGIEINEEPCKLARGILGSIYSSTEVICGDAFKIAWNYKADIIVSNPPFVRWHLVHNRDEVLKAIVSRGYGRFISRGDPGLHILSFFLMDYILRSGGYMLLVMPASAFYTSQGRGLKELIRAKYDVLAFVENGKEPSFSVGSGFKEVVIFLRKRVITRINNFAETTIYRYDGALRRLATINLAKLPKFADRNWLSFFNYDKMINIISIIEGSLNNGLMRYLRRDEIIRGIEMYGPEFFFIPNKYWRIAEEARDYVVITNNDEQLELPRSYLIPCLRKPEYYESEVVIHDPGFYALAIGNEPSGDVLRYVKWGEKVGVPALKFGNKWYQHVWRQLQSKKPYGYVFIHDKIDLARHRVIANYSDKPLCASKNFYIVRINNPMIAAWYNSEVFRELLTVFGRKISQTWTRLLEDDYLSIPIPTRVVHGINLISIKDINNAVTRYLGLKN